MRIREEENTEDESDVPARVEHGLELLDIIEEHGPIDVKDLYERYRDRVDDPRGRRSLSKYLARMKGYGVENEVTSKGVIGTKSTYWTGDDIDIEGIMRELWTSTEGFPKHLKADEEKEVDNR